SALLAREIRWLRTARTENRDHHQSMLPRQDTLRARRSYRSYPDERLLGVRLRLRRWMLPLRKAVSNDIPARTIGRQPSRSGRRLTAGERSSASYPGQKKASPEGTDYRCKWAFDQCLCKASSSPFLSTLLTPDAISSRPYFFDTVSI